MISKVMSEMIKVDNDILNQLIEKIASYTHNNCRKNYFKTIIN